MVSGSVNRHANRFGTALPEHAMFDPTFRSNVSESVALMARLSAQSGSSIGRMETCPHRAERIPHRAVPKQFWKPSETRSEGRGPMRC